ncbi:MAG: 1-acyl-sn-glycerol-3-phosphate acyltransferase [Planctomycetaceae bacterium]|jgi:1-acyl-sn-glycerol-3-phosphate acyltransferase|nr:1-acyl-sn-glycerol-3-phosphate acyltransferase [Planctomycetaceae bacterium]
MSSSESKNSLPKKAFQRTVPWPWRVWYHFCRWIVLLFLMIFYRVRYLGIPNIAFRGGALLVSNHQSFLDPMAIGAAVPEKLNYLARKTLFRFKPFGRLLDSLDTIPLNQEGLGFEGIKETIKRLKNGEKVLIFPEGERCRDGKMLPFKKGVMTLAVKTKVPIIPAAISGAYESWPRGGWPRFFPGRFGAVRVIYDEPIPYEKASRMSEEELHDFVENRVHELYSQLAEQRCLIR